MKFKKGQLTQESYDAIIYDLDCLALKKTKDNEYHLTLLRENLNDIFGRKKTTQERLDAEERL
jgi:hypothetical protein